MREPTLREIDAKTFRRLLGGLLEVYIAAMDPPPAQLPGRQSIMLRHATYPGFRALVVEQRRVFGATPVAFAYGFHGAAGQWWHDVVDRELRERSGREHATSWLSDAWEVAELHVRPDHQGQGLGRSLLTTLCAGRRERTAVLSTLDRRPQTPAQHLYRSVGFHDLLSAFEFPGGGPPYAVMGARLPLARVEAPAAHVPR
ncbi:ribosomal protein S18 acetylase RimI-like enzyme [Actinocorallia herbida]|uniref:Ribosomal protein S18 acetylase RimI-like enzyme n=1 Tax=Actinocorallia herbida TaxID=58109 RepID=A0A3N1CRF1_9ACTN|nr:GNAT family N-acetyltransferase [Actinocorallia herbida]ROO83883.1 ribosomal protein S18 acetylase RimI-like enzyme [Actinocorallia herbida]